MDFDTYLGYNENAFEDQYAEEMEMLNDLEGPTKSDTVVSSSKKKLFDDAGPSHCSESHLLNNGFENDLIIDEELFETSPKRKRPKMDKGFEKKHNLPTTLDEDREAFEMKKKQRTVNNVPDSPAMIEKILKYRENKIKDTDNKEFLNKDIQNSTQTSRLQLTKVLVRPPVYCDFISTTSSDGDRFYMRIYPEEKLYKDQNFEDIKSEKLLSQSISEMRQEIHLMRENRILAESHSITEHIRRQNISVINENDIVNTSSTLNDSTLQDAQKMVEDEVETDGIYSEDESSKHALWLNKYAPTQYTHLLSDESVNRALLKWLKMWDHVVFGHELPQKKVNKNEQKIKNRTYGFKKTFQFNHFEDKFDEYNRPHWKIVLLCGPPGLGKTTLAHIIAKHAGYHVVEMNASDDRSAEAFRNKLEETTQMRSVLGHDQRPNCLIIDEIDGAPVAAIMVLLAAVNKVKTGKQTGTRKKRTRNNILLRPIICICNDLYVPALRQLRQHSFVLQFPPTQTACLASRLTQLCRLQQLQCDLTSLLTLCEKTENDIRSCINTLQFLKSCGTNKLDIHAIKNMNIGQKDQHKSIFNVWQEIFQLPKTKRKMEKNAETVQLDSQLSQQRLTVLATRFYTIYHLVLSNGEYDKTLQGVYENFLKMKFKDHDLAFINKAQEWLQFQDVQSVFFTRYQDWTMMKFSPFVFVLFHMLFACVSVPRITFPTQNFENTKHEQKCANFLESMYSDMAPIARCFVSKHVAILDFIPYILEIMVPSIRPVNTQLFSPEEKKLIKDLVNTMLTYNLTYRQERNEDGQYNYVLEPNVAEICIFPGFQHRKLSYATRQMIAKEVETERMRRSEHVMEVSVGHVKPKLVEKPLEKFKPQKGGKKKDSLPNHLQRLEKNISNAVLPREKPVVDFFSKFKKVKKVALIAENGADRNESTKRVMRDPAIGNSAIWFKFNEGVSNAVRQTVKVKWFM